MIIPFLPIYLLELGVPKDDVALWSGLSLVLPSLSLAVWRLYGGKIADNKGQKTDGSTSWFPIAVCYVLIGMVTDQYQLLMGRALVGFC